jgi:hypothetical protein
MEYIGQRVQCKHCGRPFSIPRTLAVACPECGVHETFRTQDLGRVIRCNRCDAVHEVTAGVDGGPVLERVVAPWPKAPGGSTDPLGIDGLDPGGIGPQPGDKADSDRGGDPGRIVDFGASRDEVAWRGPVEAIGANGADPSLFSFTLAIEDPRDDDAARAELEEARSQLDRLRSEVESLRSRSSEAERLTAQYDALREQADERSRHQEELRIELEATRSELERLASEAAALQGRAASAEHFEDELRATRQEVARLQADYQQARTAVETATREFADLLDHSAALQDGFYLALAEIETNSTETLLAPREAERLRTRLVELEGQVAEAATARRATEDDLAHALRTREQELEATREELRTLHGRMKELAALEAEEARLRAPGAPGRVADDELAAEVAEHLGSAPRLPAWGAVGRVSPGWRPAQPAPSSREPATPARTPANGSGGSDRGFPRPASNDVAAPQVDIALETIDIREFLPQPMDSGEARPVEAVAETTGAASEPGPATRPAADRDAPDRPQAASGPPIDLDALKAEAQRLRTEILDLISAGRKKEAEVLSRRMVDLNRTIAGEFSRDHAIWMTVVGQLQAEQGDLAGARATFDHKNAAFRDRFGERDHRYLSCLADSAEALRLCGDSQGARVLFEAADALARQTFDAAHPYAITVRRKLDLLRGQGPNLWTVQACT